ncbi:Uncharacterised protein [Chlamydia trachomatis]|nr:Uncharacterised protein [Chlamydia trachomatis]
MDKNVKIVTGKNAKPFSMALKPYFACIYWGNKNQYGNMAIIKNNLARYPAKRFLLANKLKGKTGFACFFSKKMKIINKIIPVIIKIGLLLTDKA